MTCSLDECLAMQPPSSESTLGAIVDGTNLEQRELLAREGANHFLNSVNWIRLDRKIHPQFSVHTVFSLI